MIARIVTKAFEAWDPAFEMDVILNAGARVRVLGVVFNRRLAAGRAPLHRAVEFEWNGARYVAELDRLYANTEQAPDVGGGLA